ncbi:hypothetical protein P9112_006072 [Eukaryota sp. TZLM1-RC]
MLIYYSKPVTKSQFVLHDISSTSTVQETLSAEVAEFREWKTLHGIVLDVYGHPVTGAKVVIAEDTVLNSGVDGNFEYILFVEDEYHIKIPDTVQEGRLKDQSFTTVD